MRIRLLLSALLSFSLLAGLTVPGDPGRAQELAIPGPRWIAFEEGNEPAGPELRVTASDAGRIDLAAQVPGCMAAEVEAEGETFTWLGGDDFGYGVQVGRPDLPVLRRSVEIPFGAQLRLELLEADVAEYDLQELGIHHRLYPLQPPLPKTPGAQGDRPLVVDTPFYETDAFYPSGPLAIGEEYIVRGHRAVVVEVWPVAYNPVAGRVRLVRSVQFRLALSGSDMARTEALARRYASPAFEGRLARQLLNFNQGRPGLLGPRNGSVGYLIITADAYSSSMLPFVALKTAQGFDVTMTNLSSIPGGTTNTAIKNYIQNAYDTWPVPPSYVLLVGDTDTMPAWNSVAAGEVTDLYYGTMDGSGDWVPDIGRGRFPVRSAGQAEIMVDKAIAYAGLAGNEEWLKEIAFIATCDEYTIAEGTHNYVIGNYTEPEGYTGQFPNDPQPGGDRLYCITHDATEGDIQAALDDGRWAVIYSGHGGWDGWEMGFDTTNVQALTSIGVLPFVASHACITGDFAVTQVYGEAWVLQENKGALVFWGSSDSSYWGEDDVLERAMFDSLFGIEPQPSVAGMTDYGLAAVQAAYPGHARYYWETYNVLGDPSVGLLIEAPGFTLAASPSEQGVSVTGVATYEVEVGQVLSYTEPVSLSVGGLPANSQTGFDRSVGIPPFSATLRVTTTSSTPLGSYTLTITGTAEVVRVQTVQVQLTVHPRPDLEISQTAAADVVEVGMPLDYALRVSNAGGPATGVGISATLPAEVLFKQASDGGTLAGDAVVWSGLNLPSGAALTVTYVVTVTCVSSGTQIISDDYQVAAFEWPTPTSGLPVTVTARSQGVAADFSTDTPVLRNHPVAFTNLSQNAASYRWAFGDGTFSAEAEPAHAYEAIGAYTVVLTASNDCDSAVASHGLTVEDYAVTVFPAVAGAGGDPGGIVRYTLWVTNAGTLADTFGVAAAGNRWPAQLSADALQMGPGEAAMVTVEVTVPAAAASGAQDKVYVTVRSLSDPRTPCASGRAELTTMANAAYGVALGPAMMSLHALPGEKVTYTLRVTNTGNVVDTIYFSRSNPGWPTSLSVPSMAIAPGGWRKVEVYVTVLLTAAGGQRDTALVRATGSGGHVEVTLVTVNRQRAVFLPLVFKGRP